jgi:hypothetical protein
MPTDRTSVSGRGVGLGVGLGAAEAATPEGSGLVVGNSEPEQAVITATDNASSLRLARA